MRFDIGDFYGMPVKGKRSMIWGSIGIWVVIVIGVISILSTPILLAIIGGLVLIPAHWFVTVVHHYGHFLAARFTKHPMAYAILWGVIGKSVYPKKEKDVSPASHRQRALGGPIASLILSILLGVIALFFFFVVPSIAWIFILAFLDSFLINTIGAFIPLHWLGLETDGSTLLRYWGQ